MTITSTVVSQSLISSTNRAGPTSASSPCSPPGIVHTCVRVSRVYTVREVQSAIRRAHHSWRDVWPRGILWYVPGCDVSYCFWTRFAYGTFQRLCASVLCRAYTERRRSPVVYIVLCHGQGGLQIYCAGGQACGSFSSRSRRFWVRLLSDSSWTSQATFATRSFSSCSWCGLRLPFCLVGM